MSVTAEGRFTRGQVYLTMLGNALGLLLAALDQTIVATAGPAIQRSLEMEPSLYVWITSSYMVASTVLLPVWGKLSDRYGRKRALVAGALIFLLGSVLCGFSRSVEQLILFRAIQGAGSGALFATAYAVVADFFPAHERARWLAVLNMVFGVASVVGPLVGGFITDAWGWHWVFFVNVPVGAIAIGLIVLKMPHQAPGTSSGRVDVLGALTLVCALVTLLLGMTLGRPEGSAPGGFPWGSWQILGLLGFSALAFVAFWKQERRAEDPIIDPSLFSNRAFSRGLLAMFVAHAGPLAHVIFLPLFMVNVVGLSATQAGLTTTPMTMVVGVGNLLGGQLVARFGRYRSLLVTALALQAAALLLMALVLTPDVTQTQVVLVMMLVGVGTGPLSPIYLMHIQSSVEPQRVGVASAAASCGRQLGGTIGIALIGTVFASVFTAQLHSRAPELRVTIPGGEEVGASSSQLSLDSAEARARINARLEPLIVAARQQDASGQEAAVLEGERRRALDEVGQLERAMKVSFTAGITRVYQVCMLLSVLALLMTLRMPEVMMRRRSRQVEAAAVE